ncbi:MAG: T9SS type A sorting domain-containing protein [Bacteroidales bacterium]|nr:T9SS type A sorting domain-containing protein [Bacteroidales bacterium]
MKKVLLLSLSLVLGFSAIAQQRIMKNDLRQGVASSKKAVVGKDLSATSAATYAPQTATSVVVNRFEDMEDGETMWTYYDLQSNQYVANRMYQLPTGEVAVTATMSHENNQTASDRGTGYNFYDGSDWDDQPEVRVEPFKTGWPSIAQFGSNGEILLAHGNGHMQCFIRTTAGEGDWTHVGALPDYPDGYAYTTEYPTWPRIVTCGDNHNIAVAVAVLQHTISEDETDLQTVMWRSENPADINSWTVTYGPLHDLATPWDHNQFSADDYCMAANGHNVALLYSGCLTNSVWMFKSTDDGATWEPTRVWENPYEGREFDEDPSWGMEDTLFMPMNGSIVIDNSGVVHVALNTFEMAHTLENEPGYYTYWNGRSVDGILYWNDTQDPIHDTEHPEYIGTPYEAHFAQPNQHHAARLWWPIADDPGYVHMLSDSTKWIGYIPMYNDNSGAPIQWDNDMYYMSGSEYVSKFYGASGHPALSCDPNGNLACAFSTPCTARPGTQGAGSTYYCRTILVSYKNVEEGYWHQLEDDLMEDFMLIYTEGVFTSAVANTVNVGEFWFSYQGDDKIGFYWGSGATQTEGTENIIHVCKVIANPDFVNVPETEAQNVVYDIYPNPVTGNIMNVKSAQDADATITIVNLVGQTVKQFNQNLHMGENAINIDLKSGVYFCTITANGFNNTVKFVVK